MIIVCGLGNPGNKYETTRHNLGFMVVEELARTLGVSCKTQGKVVQGFAKVEIPAPATQTASVGSVADSVKVGLIRPQTFMNLSGEGVAQVFAYYKLSLNQDDTQLIVVQDDVDQPFGRLKIVVGGGAGGHNGITSIHNHLKTKQFVRVKMGIGKGVFGGGGTSQHVLASFSKVEAEVLPKFVEAAADAVKEIITGGVQSAMNKFNNTSVAPTPTTPT